MKAYILNWNIICIITRFQVSRSNLKCHIKLEQYYFRGRSEVNVDLVAILASIYSENGFFQMREVSF